MPDHATREDLADLKREMTETIQEATERLLTLIHAFMNRVDEKFAEVNRIIERYAGIADARLRRLESSETTATDRLRIMEKALDDLSKRVERLEQRPGQAA